MESGQVQDLQPCLSLDEGLVREDCLQIHSYTRRVHCQLTNAVHAALTGAMRLHKNPLLTHVTRLGLEGEFTL